MKRRPDNPGGAIPASTWERWDQIARSPSAEDDALADHGNPHRADQLERFVASVTARFGDGMRDDWWAVVYAQVPAAEQARLRGVSRSTVRSNVARVSAAVADAADANPWLRSSDAEPPLRTRAAELRVFDAAAADAREPTVRCPGCDADKPLSEYPRNRARRSGRAAWCRVCNAADQRRRRADRREVA